MWYDDFRQKKEKLIIGLMCGTSVDTVDAALCRVQGFGLQTQVELLYYLEYPVPPALRDEIFCSFQPEQSNVRQISQLNFAVGELFAEAANAVRSAAGVPAGHIDAVGSHGQTVYHIPDAEWFAGKWQRSTLQLGSPAVLAERCQATVVSDFRSRDMVAGGQGAPLVPYVDRMLFWHEQKTRILQNIGGIANFTLLLGGDTNPAHIVACDSGPGNMIIDAIAQECLGLSYDPNGFHAAQGKVQEAWLKELLQDPYYALPPPKSTGRERYGKRFAATLISRAKQEGLRVEDLLATVTELTARTMVLHYDQWCFTSHRVDEIIVSGGGTHNQTLMRRLKELCPPNIHWLKPEELGISPDAKEAIAFAVLANETLCGSPGNLPSATGATHPVLLGSITPFTT